MNREREEETEGGREEGRAEEALFVLSPIAHTSTPGVTSCVL